MIFSPFRFVKGKTWFHDGGISGAKEIVCGEWGMSNSTGKRMPDGSVWFVKGKGIWMVSKQEISGEKWTIKVINIVERKYVFETFLHF